MADSIQSTKVANIENPLARELIVARQAMIERTLNEGKRPYYKVSTYKIREIFIETKDKNIFWT